MTPTAFSPISTPAENNLTPCTNKDNLRPLDPSQKLSGTLLFKVGTQIVALDGATLMQSVLIESNKDGETKDVFGMSQNGNLVGMVSVGPLQNGPLTVVALSAQGKQVTHTPPLLLPQLDKNEYMWAGRGWIGDRLVMIGLKNNNDPSDLGILGLLDPFTGEWQQSILDELPNKYNYPAYLGAAFSPDLTRVVYVQGSPTSNIEDLVLWDLVSYRKVWSMKHYEIPSPRSVGLLPSAWVADSSSLSFVYSDESGDELVYLLDRDGISAFPIPGLSPKDRFFGLAWSPDNRYLAFYADKPVPSTFNAVYQDDIVIYDRVTQSATVVCSLENLVDDNLTAHIISHKLVWSPDNQYLVYGVGSISDETMLIIENIFTGETRLFNPKSQLYNLIGWSPIAPWVSP